MKAFQAGETIEETLRHLGYSEFRDRQDEAISYLLQGHDMLVVMPTGSGKSLIYQIAALHQPGVTVVVSPLIALMQDQVDKLEERGVRATLVNSTLSDDEQVERLEAIAQDEYKILYVAPERLREHTFLEWIHPLQVSLLAVDEAHSVSQWGHDFRPEYLHIAEFRELVGNPVTVALTATATERVKEEIIDLLRLRKVKCIYGGFDRPNIKFSVECVEGEEKADDAKLAIIETIFEERPDTVAIVYVGTRKDAEAVASFLGEQLDVEAKHYHAGMTPNQREAVQDAFIEGDLPIVVATNAFGMGIDRPDVRLVLHYSIPGSLDAYYQEAGRAGRDGKAAEAILLYDAADQELHEFFTRQNELSYDQLEQLYNELHEEVPEDEKASGAERGWFFVRNRERVGLERLEEAGVIELGEYKGLEREIRLNDWDADAVREVVEAIKAYSQRQGMQLEEMVRYAENELNCRRGMILAHFGDEAPDAPRPDCCDVCEGKLEVAEFVAEIEREAEQPDEEEAPPPLTSTVRACVQTFDGLRTPEQMVDLLHGDEKGYNQFRHSDYYGRLADYSRDELRAEIERLIEMEELSVGALGTLSLQESV